MFYISVSREVYASCHCSGVDWLFNCRSVVRFFNCIEFSSKNFVLNFSIFSVGIGFNICGGLFSKGGGGRANRLLRRMCRYIG